MSWTRFGPVRPLRVKTVKSGLPSKLMAYLVAHLVLLFWWRRKLHRSLWIIAFTSASKTLPKIMKAVLSDVLKVTLHPSQGLESLPCLELLLRDGSGIEGCFVLQRSSLILQRISLQPLGNSDSIRCYITLWIRVFRALLAIDWIVKTSGMLTILLTILPLYSREELAFF